MTKRESEVLKAIANLGGEATGFRIYQELIKQNRWMWLWAGLSGGMYAVLYRLERRGTITSHWGSPTTDTGWGRPRVYSVFDPPEDHFWLDK